MLLWINFEVQHELNLSITFLGGAVDIALRDASPGGDFLGARLQSAWDPPSPSESGKRAFVGDQPMGPKGV